MGYYLQAIIGRQQVLAHHASEFHWAQVVPLAQGIAMIPLTDELYDEIGDGGDGGRFYKLSAAVLRWALRISAFDTVAYIEAEYFGGTGEQSAVAWSGGSAVLGPVHEKGAIGQALRLFGVRANEAHDEFDAVGLGRHRNTTDWIAQQKC